MANDVKHEAISPAVLFPHEGRLALADDLNSPRDDAPHAGQEDTLHSPPPPQLPVELLNDQPPADMVVDVDVDPDLPDEPVVDFVPYGQFFPPPPPPSQFQESLEQASPSGGTALHQDQASVAHPHPQHHHHAHPHHAGDHSDHPHPRDDLDGRHTVHSDSLDGSRDGSGRQEVNINDHIPEDEQEATSMLQMESMQQQQQQQQQQMDGGNGVTPRITLVGGVGYNERGYQVCGVINQRRKPCLRLGKCPFHARDGKRRSNMRTRTGNNKNNNNSNNSNSSNHNQSGHNGSSHAPMHHQQQEEQATTTTTGSASLGQEHVQVAALPPPRIAFRRGWTRDEHIRFLSGLQIHGKGSWKEIAQIVGTRTAAQVQSHAQKYYGRQLQQGKNKRSIHDMSIEDLDNLKMDMIRASLNAGQAGKPGEVLLQASPNGPSSIISPGTIATVAAAAAAAASKVPEGQGVSHNDFMQQVTRDPAMYRSLLATYQQSMGNPPMAWLSSNYLDPAAMANANAAAIRDVTVPDAAAGTDGVGGQGGVDDEGAPGATVPATVDQSVIMAAATAAAAASNTALGGASHTRTDLANFDLEQYVSQVQQCIAQQQVQLAQLAHQQDQTLLMHQGHQQATLPGDITPPSHLGGRGATDAPAVDTNGRQHDVDVKRRTRSRTSATADEPVPQRTSKRLRRHA